MIGGVEMIDGAVTVGANHPIWKIADELAERDRMKNREKIKTRKPRIYYKPIPKIEGCRGCEGPLYVTEEFKKRRSKEIAEERARDEEERINGLKARLLDRLGKKDRYRLKLKGLTHKDKFQSQKIAVIKFYLADLDKEIKQLQEWIGIDLDECDKNSEMGTIWERVKSKAASVAKTVKKKVTKFIKRNRDVIEGVLSVIIPVIGGHLFRRYFNPDKKTETIILNT